MDGAASEFEQARARRDERRVPAILVGGGGTPAFLGRVMTTPGPGKMFLAGPVTLSGVEVDGGAVTISSPAPSLPVVWLGGTLGVGDYAICRFVDFRWVADRATSAGGGGGNNTVSLTDCFCKVPTTLHMVSAYPTCNYGMFQSCDLTYGPLPPGVLNPGATGTGFTSQQQFTDPIIGADFFYYFWCRYNQFFLTRIYPKFPDNHGGTVAFRDSTLYSWIVGGYGNQCTPFALTKGTPFPGSDASCSVQITG